MKGWTKAAVAQLVPDSKASPKELAFRQKVRSAVNAASTDPFLTAAREHRFAPPRRWRFDYAWLPQKVALEVEGAVWTGGRHTRGSGFLKDMEKYNQAVLLGWRVVRCTPQTLHTAETLDMLRRLLGT